MNELQQLIIQLFTEQTKAVNQRFDRMEDTQADQGKTITGLSTRFAAFEATHTERHETKRFTTSNKIGIAAAVAAFLSAISTLWGPITHTPAQAAPEHKVTISKPR